MTKVVLLIMIAILLFVLAITFAVTDSRAERERQAQIHDFLTRIYEQREPKRQFDTEWLDQWYKDHGLDISQKGETDNGGSSNANH